jgi:3-oxoadipate enol-lactonase
VALTTVRSDRLDLAVETFGDGPPLVFAHGLTGNRHSIRAQLHPLAERYRVVIFDQRGHGDSTAVTDPAQYDPMRMAEDIGSILDALQIDRAIVGGESMGAATALLFALGHSDRVQALLLTAPAFADQPNPDRQRLRDMGQAIATLGLSRFLELAAARQRADLHWSAAAITHVRNSLASHDPDSLATALRTVADWQILPDLSELSSLRFRACILAWHGDPLHPYELAYRVSEHLPAAQLETLPPLPAIFEDPSLVGSIYAQFLNA